MGNLDKMLNSQQQEQRKTESSTEYQKYKYDVLKVLSNILYYLGFVLLIVSVILFFATISQDKEYLAIGFISCLVSGINALFFGLIGKCLIDIYNKLNKFSNE